MVLAHDIGARSKVSRKEGGRSGGKSSGALALVNKQIDRLVYERYGLTEEEIKIVEGAKK